MKTPIGPRLTLVCLLLTVLLFPAPPAEARQAGKPAGETSAARTGRRMALIIGNGAYQNAPPLRNPANDATDMAGALRALGFDVKSGVDLTQRQMKAMIREFGQQLRGGGQGLFYFAGHGVQLRGRNYLIPVDADVQSEADVEDQGVDVNLVLGLMDEAGNGLNVIILDACRNNPFGRSFRSAANGLAQMDAPGGTLIAYATAPGAVASDGNSRNGLYTQELLKLMRTPGLDIEAVFKQTRISVRGLTQGKQTPWESSSLIGNFYFTGPGEKEAAATPRTPGAPVDPTAVELAFWDSIKNSTNPEDFKDYLARYPSGQFVTIARRRLMPPPAPPPTLPARSVEPEQALAALPALGAARLDLGKFGEGSSMVQVVGQCQVRVEDRALWNSKARFKPAVSEMTVYLPDVNVAGVAVTEIKFPDRPSLWVVMARTMQGRPPFARATTGYENRTLQKVKVPTKVENSNTAIVALFMDEESANRYAKAFAAAARACGAKSETL
ncbi:MAG TPA: caspase family protein [Pyrinomonadaceae bacterium]|nr:caspase family protein [Pyrinomonadaceae bacterium]